MTNLRADTINRLQQKDIPFHPNLPTIDASVIKTPQQVAEKAIALLCLASIAQDVDPEQVLEWVQSSGADECLKSEDLFLLEAASKNKLSQETVNRLSWMQEGFYVLCWSGHIIKKLEWPIEESDISAAQPITPPSVSPKEFIDGFKLRDELEIIKHLDLYYNLHASCLHPELWKNKRTGLQLNVCVVEERRRALEWLCSHEEWDEVPLDT